MYRFDWDPEKSDINKEKHGVSFPEASGIWQSVHITVDGIARSKDGESRNATIGLINGKLYTAIWTERNKIIRLICVRRARDGEEKIFWEKAV